MIEALEANTWVLLVLGAMWFASFMTGQGLAAMWQPQWHPVFYGILLGFADRFLVFALFDGELLSAGGYFVDTAVLIAISLFAHRFTKARQMVSQYPWLYERAGLLGWREKG